jgi:hypothetical protein
MGYELHVVHTGDWLDAARRPISRDAVDRVIQQDRELAWSKTDHIGGRYDFIEWNGRSCFYWDKCEVIGKSLLDPQIIKLCEIAEALGAKLIGDDGEEYIYRKRLFGRKRLCVLAAVND